MMSESTPPNIVAARLITLQAAQWLVLIRFQVRSGAPVFGPCMSAYSAMLDPKASDRERIEACITMHPAVIRRALIERYEAEDDWSEMRKTDPFGVELKTSLQGALLDHIAHLLKEAMDAFEAAGVVSS